MELSVEKIQGISVIKIKGDLDASSYLELVNAAQEVYDSGAKNLLLDLTSLAFISSAGLASLHIITKMFRGEKSDASDGWETFKSIDRDRGSGMQNHVKLLNPSDAVSNVLDTVGFKQFFDIFADMDAAVRSFS